MQDLTNALRMDLRRAFCSPRFFIAIAALVFLNFFSIWQELSLGGSATDVLYYFDTFMLNGSFTLVAILLSIFPFSNSFCSDWNNKYILVSVIRSSQRAYAWSKIIVSSLSSFCVILIGYSLSVLALASKMALLNPLSGNHEYYINSTFGELLAISPCLFILVKILIYGVFCSFWSVFALWISTRISNIFVTLAFPIITYYAVINVMYNLQFPNYLRLNVLVKGDVNLGTPIKSFLYTILVFLVCIVIFGVLFAKNVRLGPVLL